MEPSPAFSFYPHGYNDRFAFSERWRIEALFVEGSDGWRLFRSFSSQKVIWDFSPDGILTWHEEGSDPFQVRYACFPERRILHVGCDPLEELDEGADNTYRIRPDGPDRLWLLDVLSPETYGTPFAYRVRRL